MRLLANVRLCGMEDGTAANLGRSSDHGNPHSHNMLLDPANVVSEDIALACARREVVDDNVGFRGDGTFGCDAADGVKQEQLRDLVSECEVLRSAFAGKRKHKSSPFAKTRQDIG